jgi:hypothetical protein
MSDDALHIWTIYDHPLDFPDVFVARLSLVGGDGGPKVTDQILTAPDLDTLRREFVRRGLTCITRSPNDDPVIVECWL